MKRISKAVREEAIAVLLCCADDRTSSGNDWGVTTDELVGVSRVADELANAAYDAAARALSGRQFRRGSLMFEDYTEAAALLLDGWNPGDPVEIL